MLAEVCDMCSRTLSGLGIVAPVGAPVGPYRYGTKSWWQWYASVYLPRYYNQQQIIALLQRNPLSSVYGVPNYLYSTPGVPQPLYQSPYPYAQASLQPYYGQPYQPPYQQPYYPPPNYGYGYPGYVDPYAQAQYTQYAGQVGAEGCAAQGGVWDFFQQTCGVPASVIASGSGDAPNVVGMDKQSAVIQLNALGWAVWLLNEDGYSGGVPGDYNPRRVQISVTAGKVTGSSVG